MMPTRFLRGAFAAALLISLAVAGTAEAQCPTPAPAMNQVSPNGITTPGMITVTWSASSGAQAYDVFQGLDGAPPTFQRTVLTNSHTFLGESPHGYEMYVIAKAMTCPGGVQSGTLRFSVCTAAKPLLTDPGAGATFTASASGTAEVPFNWTAVPGATMYDVNVSSDGGATFSHLATTNGENATSARVLLAPGSYIYSIRAYLGTYCPPTDSERRSFRVLPASCPTGTATLTSPAGGVVVAAGTPVTFAWNAVTSAVSYDVMVSSDDGKTFASKATVNAGSPTTASVSLPVGTHLWFVRTNFRDCPPTASTVLRVIVSANTNCPTGAPTLLTPSNNSTVRNPVKFTWTAVTGASRYRLVVSHNGGTSAALAFTEQTEFAASVPSGTIDWFVEALFTDCPSQASSRFRFTVPDIAGCPSNPGKPALLAPAAGASGLSSPVTFQWSLVSSATNYRVLASFNGGALVVLGTTSATQLTAPVSQGTVTWMVQTFFGEGDVCPATLSERSSFTVATGAGCGTNAPPALVAPANGSADVKSPVTLQWNPAPGAVNYEVFISLDGTNFELLGSTSATTLARVLPTGTLSWFVEAQFPGCPDQRSATFRFTIPEARTCAGGSITPSAPASGATVSSPVTFNWSAVTGAAAYRVWLSFDGTAPALIGRVTATSLTLPLPSGNAEWYVEATFADCPSVYSPKSRFTIQRAATCGTNPAPALVAPASGATVSSPVDLEWSAVAGAAAYRVWIASGSQPFTDSGIVALTRIRRDLSAGPHQWYVEALFSGCPSVPSARGSFTVEASARCAEAASTISPADRATGITNPVTLLWSGVANAESYRVFGSLDGTRFVLLGETRDTSITRPLPPGTITWYVETIIRGCAALRSANAQFTIARAANCSSDAPQLVSPANGATGVATPVDFVWNPVSGAVGYVLFVRFGEGTPTPIAQTEETHVLRNMPEGRFEWWVVAQYSGCPPAESAHFTFSTSETACANRRPLLLTPPEAARDVPTPVTFTWSPVPRARLYKVWASIDRQAATLLASTTAAQATVTLPAGNVRWMVEAVFDGCPVVQSAMGTFSVAGASGVCRTPDKPQATVVGQALANTSYGVRWTPLPGVTSYEIQESTTADFAGAATQVVNAVFATFTHDAPSAPAVYRYRVRGISACNDERGPYSDVVTVTVMPQRSTTVQQHASAEIGTQSNLVQKIVLPGSETPVTFTATADKPWVTITPAAGTIPREGLTLSVTADAAALNLGTNTSSVTVTYGTSGKGETHATTTAKVPVSVSLVTPVSTGGKNTPLPESLIIPAVAHAPGINDSLFESDIRLTNLGAETMKYQLNFTPSGTDATQTGNSTTVEVAPGATMALDDILASFFGNSVAIGTLEIRPLTTSSTTGGLSVSTTSAAPATVASSKTYNQTATGTFGQYIPAIPFSQFIGKSATAAKTVLSLQQVAQSQAFRTNFGIVEGAGEPAEVLLSVFDGGGTKVGEIPVSLKAGEHRQINSILAANNITLADGRIEVEVTSSTGKVTAYASTVDNATNDPLLVSPVVRSASSSTRFVLPGMADLPEPNDFRSDIRIFNAGSSAVTVTPMYYAQGTAEPKTAPPLTIGAGEVKAIDNVLPTLFGVTSSGGSVVLMTSGASSLVATGRTFSTDANGGTYGQFIPGVTPEESVGAGGRSLQILQLEHSSRFRTNIGLAETSGNAASVEVTVTHPDSRVTPKVAIPLRAHEFRQISLADFGLSDVYNARATVKVIDGAGKVTAYGSVIDQVTADPTYVPAQ